MDMPSYLRQTSTKPIESLTDKQLAKYVDEFAIWMAQIRREVQGALQQYDSKTKAYYDEKH